MRASVHEASQHKIEAILTDQQRHKFDADLRKMEKRRAWMDGRLPKQWLVRNTEETQR